MTQRDRRSIRPRNRPAGDRCVLVANGHQRNVLYSSALALILSLIVLGPQAVGVPASHGSAVFLPPYKSVGTQHVPVHVAIGCARSVGSRLSWDPSVGRISGTGTAWSKVCIKSQYGGVSSNSAQWSSALGLTIPLKVPSNGNHSIALRWTINLGARSPSTTGGCPAANLNFGIGPGNSSVGYCESGTDLGFFLWATVEDPNGVGGFSGNISDAGNDNYSYWQNVSSCTNSGTLSCSNSTYGYQYLLCYGTNEVGSASSGLAGPHVITMWVNGSNMLKSDQYHLVIGFVVYASSYASMANLVRMWPATAGAGVDMAFFGNGAVLNSIVIR